MQGRDREPGGEIKTSNIFVGDSMSFLYHDYGIKMVGITTDSGTSTSGK